MDFHGWIFLDKHSFFSTVYFCCLLLRSGVGLLRTRETHENSRAEDKRYGASGLSARRERNVMTRRNRTGIGGQASQGNLGVYIILRARAGHCQLYELVRYRCRRGPRVYASLRVCTIPCTHGTVRHAHVSPPHNVNRSYIVWEARAERPGVPGPRESVGDSYVILRAKSRIYSVEAREEYLAGGAPSEITAGCASRAQPFLFSTLPLSAPLPPPPPCTSLMSPNLRYPTRPFRYQHCRTSHERSCEKNE